MKKILILVLSADFPPYDKMVQTALETWDSVEHGGCETIYYFGKSDKQNTDKFIYFPIQESLHTMGYKTISALEWAVQNKKFDYIARVHSSTYVDKNRLYEYCENLPSENVFSGILTESQNGFNYQWGGGHFILSRDVVEKMVENKHLWKHQYMEDESLSLLAVDLDIPFSEGKSGSIDKMPDGWRIISYGGESISFTDFNDLKKLNHHYYRVKQDLKRDIDEIVMRELFKEIVMRELFKVLQ
jgi:hypothetical protein